MRLATRILLSVAAGAIAAGASSLPVWSAQVDIELFAPAREANSALQAAYRAKAQDLAPRDLRLAEVYFEDARAALNPPAGPPDEAKAASLFRLAGAAAKVAETRSVEVVRERDAAGAGNQYLEAIEGDPKRILPPRPPLGMAQAEYSRLQREAAAARAARRAAEAAFEQLRSQVR